MSEVWNNGPGTQARLTRVAVCLAVLIVGACAVKAPPAGPAVARYPDFVYPAVPPELAGTPGVERVARGWALLQADNLRGAEREFAAAVRQTPALFPALAGTAYVELARGDYGGARAAFELVIQQAPAYAPALAGQGRALLGLELDEEALAAFEGALAADPGLTELGPRIDVLRFRSVQAWIGRGRSAAAEGQLDAARTAYARALAASPDSAFLYRELGIVERGQGDAAMALSHFARAAALDPFDAMSRVQTGELLEAMMDFAGAEAAYRAASAIEPSPELNARLEALAARAREAALPAQLRAMPGVAQITRGDLAGLIGLRLEDVVRATQRPEQVMTDLRGHWAERWAIEVVRAGIMDAFENHTFQPGARLRRVDLAVAAARVLTQLAATRPDLRASLAQRPTISDVAARHLNYPQISVVVAAGVMPLRPGDRFDVTGIVSGAEAIEAIGRLRALAAPVR